MLGPAGGIVSTSINHPQAFQGCEIIFAMKYRKTENTSKLIHLQNIFASINAYLPVSLQSEIAGTL